MNEKNTVTELVERTLKNIDLTVESEKVVGERIVNEKGQTAVPINSVTVMTFSGGGEYGEVKMSTMQGEKFAGGNVTVKSIKPQFFVLDNGKGFSVVNGFDPLYGLLAAIKELADKIKK